MSKVLNRRWVGDQPRRSGCEMITTSLPGYVSWIGEVANSDAVLVDILKALGAVPYVKTNVPQTLMVR